MCGSSVAWGFTTLAWGLPAREAGKDQLDSRRGTREAGKSQLDSLGGTREAPGRLLAQDCGSNPGFGRAPDFV